MITAFQNRLLVQRFVVVLLLLAHLALTAAYSVLNPLGEAPDEADHWAYIVHLAQQRQFTVGPTITQGKHPPLYHVTAALVASLADVRNDFLRSNPDVQIMSSNRADVGSGGPNFFIHTTLEDWPWQTGVLAFHLARLWSTLLSTATLWVAYMLMRSAVPERPVLALGTLGVMAFVPEFAFIGGSANNDVLAALLGALALWGGLVLHNEGGRAQSRRWIPLALGLGLWTKVNTIALWPVVGLGILLGAWQEAYDQTDRVARTLRRTLLSSLEIFLPALMIAAPWYLRNWRLYGDPLGIALTRQTIDLRSAPWTWGDTIWLFKGWFISFWGKFGGAGHIPMAGWVYALIGGLTMLAALGLIRAWFSRFRGQERMAITLMGLTCTTTAFVMWRYSLMALGTDQGRLLYPAAVAWVGLLVTGLLAWAPTRWQVTTGIVLTALSLTSGLYGLWGVIIPAYTHPASADTSTLEVNQVQFDDLMLVAYDLTEPLALAWQRTGAPEDWRVVIRIVATENTLVWEWKRSPGGGQWSTDHWPENYIMRDIYAIHWPEWAGPGRYRVEVGAYRFGGGLVTPVQESAPTPNTQPYLLLGWLER